MTNALNTVTSVTVPADTSGEPCDDVEMVAVRDGETERKRIERRSDMLSSRVTDTRHTAH